MVAESQPEVRDIGEGVYGLHNRLGLVDIDVCLTGELLAPTPSHPLLSG